MTDFQIVTICSRFPTENYYCLNEWYKSIKEYDPLVISSIDTPYQSLCDKPKYVYRAIKRGMIKSKYMIFSDCWDFVFACQPEEMILKFHQFGSDLAFSSEKNSFPDDLRKEYDELPYTTDYRYLNSGLIIGYTEALLTTLEAMKVEEIPNDYWDNEKGCNIHFNDQFEYQKIFLQQPVKMALDYEQILCRTLHEADVSELDFSEPRIRNIDTNTYPCSFHMNGNGKSGNCRIPILKHLGL